MADDKTIKAGTSKLTAEDTTITIGTSKLTAEDIAQANAMVAEAITGNNIQSSKATNLTSSVSLNTLVGATTGAISAVSSLTPESQAAELTQNATGKAQATTLRSMYSRGNGRLVDFTYIDGSDDDERRAYMKLEGDVDSMRNLIAGEDRTILQAVYEHLIDAYTSIIITSIQENLQERQSVMPTVGDSFAATFSGLEPQLLVINGYLPLDGSRDNTWFHAFINAYKYFIRASKLAKYRCHLKIVFPDFASYVCYPVSFSSAIDSQSDTLVNFSMTAVVVSNPINKAYGFANQVVEPSNTVEEVAAATSSSTVRSEIENNVTKSPAAVGELEKKKNWVESVTDFVNTAVNSKTMQNINKAFAVADQVSGAVSAVTGKPFGTRKISGKTGRGSYI